MSISQAGLSDYGGCILSRMSDVKPSVRTVCRWRLPSTETAVFRGSPTCTLLSIRRGAIACKH
jgi:hypothetical protein